MKRWKVYIDSEASPYIVEAESEDEAIIAATNLYFKDSGKKTYSYVDASPC